MIARLFALSTGLLIGGCRNPEECAPSTSTSTAIEQARAVQSALALPPSSVAVAPLRPIVPMATVAPVQLAGSDPSIVRLLGEPPTPPATSETLPPGMEPHLYHLGGVTFFLDRQELALTPEQRTKLSAIRETAVLVYATTQRQIDQSEQELWLLTAANRPDARRVEGKLNEIARLSTQQRMEYIRAIGQAVGVLSKAQQEMLAMAPATSPPAPPMATGSGAPPMGGPIGGVPAAAPMRDAGSSGMADM